ncbi:hypothetical protein I79_011469 [Cricetulus griseus]|uniref:Uncharacterized protein n=1 Tax=Cricetulus griseus TaxID=10029 RepID=G3HL84_CRIGR|nr:hypothetical protein I79_011469 [Cricetulus griseus]
MKLSLTLLVSEETAERGTDGTMATTWCRLSQPHFCAVKQAMPPPCGFCYAVKQDLSVLCSPPCVMPTQCSIKYPCKEEKSDTRKTSPGTT